MEDFYFQPGRPVSERVSTFSVTTTCSSLRREKKRNTQNRKLYGMSEQRIILIAVDGSDQAEYAYKWFAENIHRSGDHVVIVHCAEFHNVITVPGPIIDAVEFSNKWKEEDERISILTTRYAEKMKTDGIHGRVRRTGGKPGEAIITTAKQEKASMIVTGTRGLGSMRRTFLGSVSDYVLHHSDVPVVIVRQ